MCTSESFINQDSMEEANSQRYLVICIRKKKIHILWTQRRGKTRICCNKGNVRRGERQKKTERDNAR